MTIEQTGTNRDSGTADPPAAGPARAEARIEAAVADGATALSLRGLALESVPESLAAAADALDELDLSHNRITALPVWIGRFAGLRVLDVSHNRLAELPSSLGALRSLARLDAADNHLIELPPGLGALPSLVDIDLSGNRHLIVPPPGKLAEGGAAVLAFLRELSSVEPPSPDAGEAEPVAVGNPSAPAELPDDRTLVETILGPHTIVGADLDAGTEEDVRHGRDESLYRKRPGAPIARICAAASIAALAGVAVLFVQSGMGAAAKTAAEPAYDQSGSTPSTAGSSAVVQPGPSAARTARPSAARTVRPSAGRSTASGSGGLTSPGLGSGLGSGSNQPGGAESADQIASGGSAVQAAAASAPGARISVVATGSSAAAFALSTSRTVLFAVQSNGASAWSGFSPVPNGPSAALGAPSAAIDADGHFEVFVRLENGQIADGWQQQGAPGGWAWDSALTGGTSPGTIAGDPAASRMPDGVVEVFVRLSDGEVATTAQQEPNGATGWDGWSDLGGDLAGNPVPFTDSAGDVDLFGRSAAGTLVVDRWTGARWSGWSAVGAGPADLTGDPTSVSDQNGDTEVFATTSAGTIDRALGDSAGWSWTKPLVPDLLGSALTGTPGAVRWPDGHVELFARLADAGLAHAWQNSANGATGWSGWGALPDSPVGDPTAFLGPDDTIQTMELTSSGHIAYEYWSGSEWSDPVDLPGGY